MSREKTYYSADEVLNNLYASDKQLMYTDGTMYIGLYHKYSTGEIYTEAKWNSNKSKKLIKYEVFNKNKQTYKQLKSDLNLKFKTPKSAVPKILKTNIQSGILIRYFLQKRNSKNIIEIDSKQFNDWKLNLIDNVLYDCVKILWHISGPKTDSIIDNVKSIGVISKNLQQLDFAKTKLSGITKLLSNPLQYYTDTDFIKPTDINGLDS